MLLVALVAAAPYLITIGYGFVYDDGPIIADNSALHAPAGLHSTRGVWRTGPPRGDALDSIVPWCSSRTRCSGT